MSLDAGVRLGPFEILAPLGAGGMGEVYKARDLRLERTIAIKVLPERVAASPELRRRFEREARAISQLSHPNICTVYDVGRQDGVEYLVMEYLEGKTLAARLLAGPLPLDEVMRFGRQISQALDAAHRHGIVHRDLKPGNIMLTRSGVKLLDFGLALPVPSAADLAQTPTVASDLTAEGLILGTAGYMSPEQAEGRELDSRSDIFALGAVLYEMTTGRRAFQGASVAATLSAVLTNDPPPILSVRPEAPATMEPLVALCLAKDRERRWRSAHDVDLQLESMSGSSSHPQLLAAVPSRRPRRGLVWAALGVAAVLASVALLRIGSAAPSAGPSIRFPLSPPADRAFFMSMTTKAFAVSPDGLRIAYVSSSNSESSSRAPNITGGSSRGIWVRELASLEARPVPGTEGAISVFWSPDGKALGFCAPGKLKRILLAEGAAPVPVCDLPSRLWMDGSWGSGGDILLGHIQGTTILRVPAAGGSPRAVVEAQASLGEVRLGWPSYLPGGNRFLYVAQLTGGASKLMLAEPGKPPRPIGPGTSSVQFVEPGYLVFAREGVLLAQRFDSKSGRLSGDPVSIAEQVRYFLTTGFAAFAASPAGTIVFQPHEDVSRLTWFDRAGRPLETIGPPGSYLNVAIDRDGQRAFYDRARPGVGTMDVWSWNLSRGVETPVASGPETDIAPLPVPGGNSLVYSSTRGGAPELFRRNLDGGGEEHLTQVRRSAYQLAQDLSPDGRTLAYIERQTPGVFDVWTVPVSGEGRPVLFLQSPYDKNDVRFSPDGRFLVFISNESGQGEVYATPFPGPGERIRLTGTGARLLRWSPDGKALFYVSADGRLMSLPVETQPSFQAGRATELFKIPGRPWLDFVVSRDGKKFLAVVPETVSGEQPMTVVVNWAAALPK